MVKEKKTPSIVYFPKSFPSDILGILSIIDTCSGVAGSFLPHITKIRASLSFWHATAVNIMKNLESKRLMVFSSLLPQAEKALQDSGRTKPTKDDIESWVRSRPEYISANRTLLSVNMIADFLSSLNVAISDNIFVQMSVSERQMQG